MGKDLLGHQMLKVLYPLRVVIQQYNGQTIKPLNTNQYNHLIEQLYIYKITSMHSLLFTKHMHTTVKFYLCDIELLQMIAIGYNDIP